MKALIVVRDRQLQPKRINCCIVLSKVKDRLCNIGLLSDHPWTRNAIQFGPNLPKPN